MDIIYSFIITLIAGLSTLLGTLPIFLNIKEINKFIVSSLSFSSGVMFSISTFDLLIEGLKLYNKDYSAATSLILFLLFFLGGLLLSKLIDNSIKKIDGLYKLGIMSLIVLIFHNILEGILVFISVNINKKIGMSLALAVTMHNIPEGISISVPIFYSTKSKLKAFLYTSISSLSEPIGALIAFIFLRYIINDILIATLFSLICGVMIYISLFELLKEAKKYNEEKLLNLFFIIGLLFMYITLKI